MNEQQWTGWFIPADIAKLMLTGKLSPRETILLAMIDGMVDRSDKSCWASNKILGQYLGCAERQIKRMVSKLKRMELLIQVGFDGRKRFLETCYSRINSSAKNGTPVVPKKHRRRTYTTYRSLRNSNTKGTPETFAWLIECCKMLKKVAHESRYTVCQWRNDKQVSEFVKLVKAIEDEDMFLDVFEWYCKVFEKRRELKLPDCSSPKEIRARWNWIKEKYNKHGHLQKQIKISSEAKAVVKTLLMRKWPKGSQSQLLVVVQASLDAYKEFRDLVSKAMFKTKDASMLRVIRYLKQKLPPAWMFVEGWFKELNDQIHGWTNWGGDLYAQRFTSDNKKFQAYGRDLVAGYNDRPRDWDALMELLNEKRKVAS